MIRPNIDPIRAALWQHCLECEHCIETDKEEGAWIAPNGKGTKRLSSFSFYCAGADLGRGVKYPLKIGTKADWTGTVPRWCPIYLKQKEEVAGGTD